MSDPFNKSDDKKRACSFVVRTFWWFACVCFCHEKRKESRCQKEKSKMIERDDREKRERKRKREEKERGERERERERREKREERERETKKKKSQPPGVSWQRVFHKPFSFSFLSRAPLFPLPSFLPSFLPSSLPLTLFLFRHQGDDTARALRREDGESGRLTFFAQRLLKKKTRARRCFLASISRQIS